MVGLQLPLGVDVAANDAGAAAGHVKQHFVRPARVALHVAGRADPLGTQALYAGPDSPLFGLAELVGFDVHTEDFGLVAGQRSRVKRLACGAAAAVQNSITRLGVQVGCDALRAAVVHFVPSVLKAFEVLKAGALRQHQGVGGHVAHGGLNSFGREAFEHGFARSLERIGPQNDLGWAVERGGKDGPV